MTETNTEEKKSNKCLFLLAEKGKWGVQDHLKLLKPIYNGAGWYIEEKHRQTAEQISQQAKMKLLEWPLSETFEELRCRNKREYINEKAAKTRLQIDNLKTALNIREINNEKLFQDDMRASLGQSSEGRRLLEHLKEYSHLQEQIKHAEDEEKISTLKPKIIPIVPISERIKSHNEAMKKYRGKKYLGLCVSTINEFNDKMLGLRKLILLAAAPNVGKTALTIQLANEILLNEPDACLVYVSLEMDAEEIFTRMNLYLSGLNFDTYVLGSHQTDGENDLQNLFSKDELLKIDRAAKEIEKIGDRLQIVDAASCAVFSAETIIEYVERLKSKTRCHRAIVIIDYLQVWPAPSGTFTSDIEGDKWRIGEIKKIRDALNMVNQDPVIVISEARKPSDSSNAWAGDLADVMGSARGTYTPDAVLLLNPLSSTQIKKLWEKMKMPDIAYKPDVNDIEETKDDTNIKAFLAHHGIALCSLKMPKGRDGMKKFNILLSFHFHRNKFEKVDWNGILALAMEEKNKENKKHKR